MNIRLLSREEWQIWKDFFRLKALDESPETFGSSYEAEINYSQKEWEDKLKTSDVFASFIENALVAAAGFYSGAMLKTKHKGLLFGMYTMPDYRGRNIASELIQAITIHAKTKVIQLHLNCITQNQRAKKLYEKHGFKIYGTEPRSLKVGENYFDDYLMVKFLD